jgi:hypothetical protein
VRSNVLIETEPGNRLGFSFVANGGHGKLRLFWLLSECHGDALRWSRIGSHHAAELLTIGRPMRGNAALQIDHAKNQKRSDQATERVAHQRSLSAASAIARLHNESMQFASRLRRADGTMAIHSCGGRGQHADFLPQTE